MQLFQGEKPAHDFLSLHTGGGASSPVQHHSTQAAATYDLGVHNTLKPLKLSKQRGRGAIAMASSGLEADSEERVLPGGVGTFSIRQVASAQSRGEAASHGVVRGAHGGAESGARAAHSGPSTMLEILRELLPHGDQKRDKASFLLETKVYYRSCWKNTQNISQVQGGGLSASTQDVNNEQCGSKTSTVAPAALFSPETIKETSTDVNPPQKVANTAQNWEKNSTSNKQTSWLSMSTSDSGNRPLSTNERETGHKDTHSLSDAYSQGYVSK
ncbi:hypothetical protein PR202_gb09668 [Eleusine coracana subsp. coracana]|uniref:Uncharacterized protein n=1 Tax=Eleusine coracana subsp. coracana TaxID=191504 RepID=A0AAV5EHZ9_ELECO|nr:hypothetical protein PR202_gb09668 [Eleusine coracana subsp. coracana]